MLAEETKSKIGSIWNTMWSGGISNPLLVMERLTYLLFIRRLDKVHAPKEAMAARLDKPVENPICTSEQDGIRWSRFKETAPEQMFETVSDKATHCVANWGGRVMA